MRFIYLDANLRAELGHHANYARSIVREMRALNIDTVVVANAAVEPELRAELGARPHFRVYVDAPQDHDPAAGWLNTFDILSQITRDELRLIGGIRSDDLVYFSSLYPALFMGLAKWAGTLEPAQLPTIAADFCVGPGLHISVGADHQVSYALRDPREDPSALLFGFAARKITKDVARRLTLASFDRPAAAAFQVLLGHPVQTWPAPIQATTSRRSRTGTRPITVSVLGHQRPDKGYDHVPEVVAGLLRARSDVRVLVHNGSTHQMRTAQSGLRALAQQEDRLELDETMAGPEIWGRLLDRSDLIVCPYHPGSFVTRFSALTAEAIANAIPLVVPAHTSLASLVAEFGGSGTTFEAWTPASILQAVHRALDDFDRHAAIAVHASERWAQTQGPRLTARSLLALVQSPAPPG